MFLVSSAIASLICIAIIVQNILFDRAIIQRSNEIIMRVNQKEKQLDEFHDRMKKELSIITKR